MEDWRITGKVKNFFWHQFHPIHNVQQRWFTESTVIIMLKFGSRYRGLKSFRTSPWDAKENLPSDYARIFQFQDFRRTKKRVLAQMTDTGAMVCCIVMPSMPNHLKYLWLWLSWLHLWVTSINYPVSFIKWTLNWFVLLQLCICSHDCLTFVNDVLGKFLQMLFCIRPQ